MLQGQFKRRHKITDMYSPINRTLRYMTQKLTELKGEIGKYTIMVGDFNTFFSVIERYRRSVI